MLRPACFTDDEWRAWQEAEVPASLAGRSPCWFCTPEFHAAMMAAGTCDGTPGTLLRGQPSDDPKVIARRAGWRESQRRKVARQAGLRGSLGVHAGSGPRDLKLSAPPASWPGQGPT